MIKVSPNLLSEKLQEAKRCSVVSFSLLQRTHQLGIESHSREARLVFVVGVNSFVIKGPHEKLTFFGNQRGPIERNYPLLGLFLDS